mgnify:CR=1 FL=1
MKDPYSSRDCSLVIEGRDWRERWQVDYRDGLVIGHLRRMRCQTRSILLGGSCCRGFLGWRDRRRRLQRWERRRDCLYWRRLGLWLDEHLSCRSLVRGLREKLWNRGRSICRMVLEERVFGKGLWCLPCSDVGQPV